MTKEPMRIFIAGAKGQLGYELIRSAPADATLCSVDLPDLDVSDFESLQTAIRNFQPTVVINAAAYTAVDKAEAERDVAFKVNRDAARNMAEAAQAVNARFLHVSTDFVFDGQIGRPYLPSDPVCALSVYGESKAQGDAQVLAQYPSNSLVVRTAWVYSAHGGNFVKTILKLLREREQLSVIADQIGTPTWAGSLASSLWTFSCREETGIWHFTDAGTASWYDFAVAIAEEALALEMIDKMKPILPIRTQDYQTPAKRPGFSVLDKTQTWSVTGVPDHWRVNLRQVLRELKNSK